MKCVYVEHIKNKLDANKNSLKVDFEESLQQIGVRYCFIDDLLPIELAEELADLFPSANDMRLMSSFREKKFTSKSFEKFDDKLRDITFAIQSPEVISIIEKITGIPSQIPDNSLYAGGLSSMGKDCFLNPHIDNSHEAERKYYRTLNLLYYISPNWQENNGGNLELWDNKVKENILIHSKFNRLVLMETNPTSWHSVNKVVVNGYRNCISNYYFSEISPTSDDYFNVTTFSARPNQLLRRITGKFDALLRNTIRKVVPSGIGKKDIYKGKE